MSEQIGLNYQGILANQQKIGELEEFVRKLCTIIDDIHESLEHYGDRLHALEEKERARARDERDVNG